MEEVDKKIEELREREKLFERGCTEEQVSEEDAKLLTEIKTKKSSGQRQAAEKKVIAEEEFPTIWSNINDLTIEKIFCEIYLCIKLALDTLN